MQLLFFYFLKRKRKQKKNTTYQRQLLLCIFCLMVILSINSFRFVFWIYQSRNAAVTNPQPLTEKDSHWKKNIVFIKVHKVGGSTFGGVVRRAATKLNLSGTQGNDWIDNEPGLWAVHTPYIMLKSKIDQLKEPTFLTTMIRSPENRALSDFYYFTVSIKKQKTRDTDSNIINFLKRHQNDHMLNYISNYSDSVSPSQVCGLYDLIGVNERFDESILVLKHMLNISLEDILYIAAKNSTTSSDRVTSRLYDDQSETVKAYIDTVFREHNKKDRELYQVANQRLDEYIGSIPGFHNELMILRSMLKTANEKCGRQPRNESDCYYRDHGCGIKCLDEIKVTDHRSS